MEMTFSKDQIEAINTFLSACENLNRHDVELIGWNDGTFDAVNTRQFIWDIVEGEEINYPHDDKDFHFKDMVPVSIYAGYAEDGYGIKLIQK